MTLLLLFCVVLIAACGGGGGGGAEPTHAPVDEAYPADVLQLGSEVYDDTCSVCHGRDGKGGIGASLIGVASRLSYEEHRRIVTDGKGTMPAFSGTLTAEEVDAVVAFERVGLG